MTKQQGKNRKFRTSHLTSTLSMSLVLFLVGMVSLLLFVARDGFLFERLYRTTNSEIPADMAAR